MGGVPLDCHEIWGLEPLSGGNKLELLGWWRFSFYFNQGSFNGTRFGWIKQWDFPSNCALFELEQKQWPVLTLGSDEKKAAWEFSIHSLGYGSSTKNSDSRLGISFSKDSWQDGPRCFFNDFGALDSVLEEKYIKQKNATAQKQSSNILWELRIIYFGRLGSLFWELRITFRRFWNWCSYYIVSVHFYQADVWNFRSKKHRHRGLGVKDLCCVKIKLVEVKWSNFTWFLLKPNYPSSPYLANG